MAKRAAGSAPVGKRHASASYDSPPSEAGVLPYHFGTGDCTDVDTYDLIRYASVAGRYKQEVMRSVYRPLLGSISGTALLDVACGTGRGALDFAVEALNVVALDLSLDMLSAAKKKTHAGVWLVSGLAQNLPFQDEQFDVAVSLNFMHLFRPSMQRVFVKEMVRVLRPGGIVLLEFDNVLHAGGVGLLRRWIGGEYGSSMAEIRSVVPQEAEIIDVKGALIPYMWHIFCRVPGIGKPLERFASLPVLNRIVCRRLYVKARKRQ